MLMQEERKKDCIKVFKKVFKIHNNVHCKIFKENISESYQSYDLLKDSMIK